MAGNTVANSQYTGWSQAPSVYPIVTNKDTTDPGIPIQSEYSMAVSTSDTEQISSEYSMAGNVYNDLRGEQPEYAVVNKPKKNIFLSEEEKESPSQPVSGTEYLNAIPKEAPQEISPSEEVIPVYAQPDLSKKKKHFPLLITSESVAESPPPIPPQSEAL